MADQKFVEGVYLKKGMYGTKVSFNTAKFVEWLNQNTNEKGYCNIEIKTAKGDYDKLYAVLDTWQPKPQDATKTEPADDTSPF